MIAKKSARRTRRKHAPVFGALVAPVALREDKTMAELYKHFEVHATEITEWKRHLIEHATDAFGGGADKLEPVDLAPLHAKMEQLTLENNSLEGALTKAGLLSAKRWSTVNTICP